MRALVRQTQGCSRTHPRRMLTDGRLVLKNCHPWNATHNTNGMLTFNRTNLELAGEQIESNWDKVTDK